MIINTGTACLDPAREQPVAIRLHEAPGVVALAVAERHHAYPSWDASVTRAP
jgi:hypothetical protein